MSRHIIHLAVKPRLQPFGQPSLGLCQLHSRNRHGIETERLPVRLDRSLQTFRVIAM